jgi:hypothetical protein
LLKICLVVFKKTSGSLAAISNSDLSWPTPGGVVFQASYSTCYPSGRPRRNVRRRLTRRRGPRGVWPATGDLINDGDVQGNDHDMMVSINGIPQARWMAYHGESQTNIRMIWGYPMVSPV